MSQVYAFGGTYVRRSKGAAILGYLPRVPIRRCTIPETREQDDEIYGRLRRLGKVNTA